MMGKAKAQQKLIDNLEDVFAKVCLSLTTYKYIYFRTNNMLRIVGTALTLLLLFYKITWVHVDFQYVWDLKKHGINIMHVGFGSNTSEINMLIVRIK